MVLAAAVAAGLWARSGDEAPNSFRGDYGPAGTPIAAGLTVPEGASLAGAVFAVPEPMHADGAISGSVAVLDISGNPLDVWDALAAQAADAGAALTATGGGCQWLTSTPDSVGAMAALDGRGPPEATGGLQCVARGVRPAGERPALLVDVELGSSSEAALAVVRVWELADVHPAAVWGDAMAVRPTPGEDRAGAPRPGGPAPLPRAGEPFGSEINCLARGYDRLVVPPSARVLALGDRLGSGDYVAVLAVDDAEAALRDLADQMEGEPPRDVDAVGGGRIWRLDNSVEAGGGSCVVTASPDGHALLVEPHSD